MGLLNPVYALFIPFILGITVPLAVIAGITSTFAFSVLICRVIVVYLDLIISIVSRSLFGLSLDKRSRRSSSSVVSSSSYSSYLRRSPPSSAFSPSPAPSSPASASYFQLPGPSSNSESGSGSGGAGEKQPVVASSPAGSPSFSRRHYRSGHHRRGSVGGTINPTITFNTSNNPSTTNPLTTTAAVTAGATAGGGTATPVSETGLGLIPSVGPERDFEGIGGWRSGGDDDDIWTGINSRLELPDAKQQQQQLARATAAAAAAGDNGVLMMKSRARSREKKRHMSTSPNSSRIRARSGSRFGNPAAGQASTTTGPSSQIHIAASGAVATANRGTKRAPAAK